MKKVKKFNKKMALKLDGPSRPETAKVIPTPDLQGKLRLRDRTFSVSDQGEKAPCLTHFNEQGHAKMVDVSDKRETVRTAIARSSILVNAEIYDHVIRGKMKKGDVLSVAQVAGIMAAKKTSDVIPMCHPLALQGVDISFEWKEETDGFRLVITTAVKVTGQTGVEMEALTAASVTALTVYDMCKAVDKGMVIGETYLLEKKGGVSSPDYQI